MTELLSRLSPRSLLILIALLGGAAVAGLTAAGAEIYEGVSDHDGVAELDRPALDQALAWRTPWSERLVTWFTHLGGTIGLSVIAVMITALMAWRWRSRTAPVLMILAAAGSATFTLVGKAMVGRPRPPLTDAVPPYEYAFSFPSGHALSSTVIAGMVAYLMVRRLRTRRAAVVSMLLAGLWSVAMGLSRVYLGHHWLSDVVFAWVLGLAWLALLIAAHRSVLVVRRARRTRPDTSSTAASTASLEPDDMDRHA